MAYKGASTLPGEELESVRRMRESQRPKKRVAKEAKKSDKTRKEKV